MDKRSFAAVAVIGTLASGICPALEPAMPPAPADVPVLVLKAGAAVPVKSAFLDAKTGVEAGQQTHTTIRAGAEDLTISFECEDSAVLAGQEGRDNIKLWKDDSVYVWLTPGHGHRDGEGMIMVQVSAGGVVLDQKDGDPSFNIEGLDAVTATNGSGWTATVTMPFKGLGLEAPEPGAAWGFNLTRMDHPGEVDQKKMVFSSLVRLPEGDGGRFDQWGHLIFTGGDSTEAVAAGRKAIELSHKARIDKLGAEYYRALLGEQQRLAGLEARRGIPANPGASEDVRNILEWISGLPERKENRFFLSQHLEWNDAQESYDRHVESLAKTTGEHIAMIELSYQDPSSRLVPAEHLARINQAAIRFWKAGHLIGMHWNPQNPWVADDKPSYGDLRNREKLADILVKGTPEHDVWMKKLDRLAELFAELRDAGVVVLWRPLHEMTFVDCYWYDFGATGSGDAYQKIWRHMFKYFSEDKKLDNLIWIYSVADVGSWNGPAADSCYPGPDYVDIVGISLYRDDAVIGGDAYERLTALGKPFALSEFGQGGKNAEYDSLTLIDAIRWRYPKAVYANYWYTAPDCRFGIFSQRNASALLKHPWMAGRDDLDWKKPAGDEGSAARP